MERRPFLPALHVLRGVAAISVVLLHVRLWRTGRLDATYPAETWLFHFGYGGVYLFFVLSGFFMVHVAAHRRGLRAACRFGWARFARTVPPYWIVVAITGWLYATNATLAGLQGIPTGWQPWAFYWANATVARLDLIPVGWTLAYEWWFYAVFTGTYVLVGAPLWWCAAAAWLASMAAHPDAAAQVQHLDAAAWWISTNSFGLILGTVLATRSTRPPWVCWGFVDAAAQAVWPCLYTTWIVSTGGVSPYMELVWPLVWAPLVWGLVRWEQQGPPHPPHRRPPRVLLVWGDASYTLYLTHQLLIWLAFAWLGYRQDAGAFVPLFGFIGVVAIAWYRWIDRPVVAAFRWVIGPD